MLDSSQHTERVPSQSAWLMLYVALVTLCCFSFLFNGYFLLSIFFSFVLSLFHCIRCSLRCMGFSLVAVPGLTCSSGMWDLSFQTRDQICIPCTGRQIINHWMTRDVPVLLFWKWDHSQMVSVQPLIVPSVKMKGSKKPWLLIFVYFLVNLVNLLTWLTLPKS